MCPTESSQSPEETTDQTEVVAKKSQYSVDHYNLVDKAEKKIGKLEINLKGHSVYLDEYWFLLARLPNDKLETFLNESGVVTLNRNSSLFACVECGEKLTLQTDGKSLYIENPCPFPNGHPDMIFELNVPSGKMIAGNDFRSAFPIVGQYYVNYNSGIAKTTYKYAQTGLAHAFVGNTCPGIYKIAKDKFVIGVSSETRKPVPHSKEVGSICTDLWWYSVADYDEFMRRTKNDEKWAAQENIIKCAPGVYRFTHQYHRKEVCDAYPAVYTYIEKIREPDPVVDYAEAYNALNYTAEQVGATYKDHWDESPKRIADQLLVVCGAGSSYHPNGWFSSYPDINQNQSIEFPKFGADCKWYPLGNQSPISYLIDVDHTYTKHEAIFFNESFVNLSCNILHSILISPNENNKDFALEILKGTAKKYKVPDYCKDFL